MIAVPIEPSSVRHDHQRYALRDPQTCKDAIRNLTHDQAQELAEQLRERGHRFEVVPDRNEARPMPAPDLDDTA